jgi:hypothetical protein
VTVPPDESDDEPVGGQEPMDPRSMDEAFAAIVAGIRHGDPPAAAAPWPAAEDDTAADREPPTDHEPPTAPRLGSTWAGWEDVTATAADAEPDDETDDDEDFVPPTPPPIPRGDAVLRWAWVGAVGAPIMALFLAVIGWDFNGLVGLGLVSAFLAGFATLVSRMRTGPTDRDNPDDGAVL